MVRREVETLAEHIIEISRDEAFLARLAKYRTPDEQDRRDAYRETITCCVAGGCGGWQVCMEPHEINGVNATDSPYGTACSCAEAESTTCSIPWCGYDGFEFHGVWHEWRWGYAWTVPYEGCVLAEYDDYELPDGIDTTRDGRWLVEDDWDDTDCSLMLIREVTQTLHTRRPTSDEGEGETDE